MQQRILGNKLAVSELGYGAMGLSGAYGTANDKDSIQLLQSTLALGINFFDTADVYGNGHNETLLAQAFSQNRHEVIIATKAALTAVGVGELIVNNTPDYLRAACDASLKRLRTDYIDLYYIHRIDPNVPIEDSVGALADLVKAGKVRYLGLSEAAPETIIRAHKVHPLTAIQSEYSLWSRDIEYNDVLKTCNQLNIGFVPYSPLGRGFLTATINAQTQYETGDFRQLLPRFKGETADKNLTLVEKLAAFASSKHATAAQVALAWVLDKGDHIVPIPGTRNLARVNENIAATALHLSCDEMEYLDELFATNHIMGERYPDKLMQTVNK